MPLKSIVAITFMLSCSLAAASEEKKDDADIQGTWLPSAAEMAGQPLPESVRKSIKLVVNDGKYTVTAGSQVDRGSVKLNSAAKPKEIDITGAEGPNKGKKILAIYERNGDTLRICYDLSGKGRPAEFKSARKAANSSSSRTSATSHRSPSNSSARRRHSTALDLCRPK